MALAQLIGTETETFHRTGPEILYQDISPRDRLGRSQRIRAFTEFLHRKFSRRPWLVSAP